MEDLTQYRAIPEVGQYIDKVSNMLHNCRDRLYPLVEYLVYRMNERDSNPNRALSFLDFVISGLDAAVQRAERNNWFLIFYDRLLESRRHFIELAEYMQSDEMKPRISKRLSKDDCFNLAEDTFYLAMLQMERNEDQDPSKESDVLHSLHSVCSMLNETIDTLDPQTEDYKGLVGLLHRLERVHLRS